ncbi:clathrin assembly protein [Iris pallida]|uniref:Clathrin assembly protein n=1 Tax=Iris pallida TaxID=29817 RepID=A0AAX6HS97_IRIPA|nr:clathrin assembly protein [Iris pallida]
MTYKASSTPWSLRPFSHKIPMGQKFRDLVGIMKDKASLTITTLTAPPPPSHSPAISPDVAVLRATGHAPSSLPPDDRQIAALLSFGSSSRLSASSLVHSLASRLSAARDPSVALKSLLSLHRLLLDGSFILLDTVYSAFLPSSGRRSPLNLSSFRSASSLPLSSWVRYYARLLELLLRAKPLVQQGRRRDQSDTLTSLSNGDLLKEMDLLVAAAEETGRTPPTLALERNMLVAEVTRLVERERTDVLHAIAVRVREVKERLGELGFAGSVELVCLARRAEQCRRKDEGKLEDSLWSEVKGLRERVGEVVAEERGRVRREKASESARFLAAGPAEAVRFGSSRWSCS